VKGRKAGVFFFEKKKQKTFVHLASVCGEMRQFEARQRVCFEARMDCFASLAMTGV
jgi:cold shock CspA family protein